MKRLIFHVDMDAFFAAIEQRDHPEYRGKPVIVGGLSGRGVVSTCSYEARKFGVRSALPMARARTLCPDAIFLAGNHEKYRAVSREIFAIFHRFSPLVEGLSIDEAFLDMTGMERIFQQKHTDARGYATTLKETIQREVGLTASVGIAPNKFLAKIASDLEKPNGLTLVSPDHITEFLHPLPVSRVWGVGAKTARKLKTFHVETIGDLAQIPKTALEKAFGQKMSEHLYTLARGIDTRPVEPKRRAKSIGKEVTFPEDLYDRTVIAAELLLLSEKVAYRLRKSGERARTIHLKVRRKDFTTWTRSKTLPDSTCYEDVIYQTAKKLFEDLAPKGGVRLLGVSASGFDESFISLFRDEEKQEKIYKAVDALRDKFGEASVGRLLRPQKKEPKAAHDFSDLP